MTMGMKRDPDWIFECCFSGCDWQFEDALDLIEHCVQEPNGHVATHFKDSNPNDGEFQCVWKNCGRVKKGANPFPNLARLIKHVRDIHIMKGNGRIIHPDMRSKHLVLCHDPKRRLAPNVPSSRSKAGKAAAAAAAAATANANANANAATNGHAPFLSPLNPSHMSQAQASAVNSSSNGPIMLGTAAQAPQIQQPQIQRPPPPQPEPLFVAVPPRPQKLLHSEAYIRYIESLHTAPEGVPGANAPKTQPSWEKSLKATVANTVPPDMDKVPVHWLGNGAGNHGSTINALWALRDFMMKDALNLKRILE
jgi:protein polybromo-1